MKANTEKMVSWIMNIDGFIKMNPYIQRGYEWNESYILPFINDIIDACVRKQQDYYIKTFTICKKEDEGNYSFYVYDGQQRLTTLILFFIALKNRLSAIEDGKASFSIDSIDKALKGSDWKRGISDLKLNLKGSERDTENDNSVLKDIYRNRIDKGKKNTHILRKAYGCIEDYVSNKMTDDEILDCFRCLRAHLVGIIIECDNETEAIKMFNTDNSRQCATSAARNVQSFLYEKAHEKGVSYLNEPSRSQFLYQISNTDDDVIKKFHALYAYYKGIMPYNIKKIYSNIKNISERMNIDIVDDMHLFWDNYASLIFEENFDDLVVNGERVGNKMSILNHPFIQSAMMQEAFINIFSNKYEFTLGLSIDYRIRLYKLFEWAYITNVALNKGNSSSNQTEHIIGSYKKNDGDLYDYCVNKLKSQNLLMQGGVLTTLERQTKSPLFTGLLLREEWQLCQENKEKMSLWRDYTLEHIIPQREEKINKLGNLTLLSQKKNCSAGAKTFSEKRHIYKESRSFSAQLISRQFNTDTWNDEYIRQKADMDVDILRRFYDIEGI